MSPTEVQTAEWGFARCCERRRVITVRGDPGEASLTVLAVAGSGGIVPAASAITGASRGARMVGPGDGVVKVRVIP